MNKEKKKGRKIDRVALRWEKKRQKEGKAERKNERQRHIC